MLVCGYGWHKAVRVMPGCAFSFLRVYYLMYQRDFMCYRDNVGRD